MSRLLSMLALKLMTIKMGEFKIFTIKLCFRAGRAFWGCVLMCAILTHPPLPLASCQLAVDLCIGKQKDLRANAEEKAFKGVNLILF